MKENHGMNSCCLQLITEPRQNVSVGLRGRGQQIMHFHMSPCSHESRGGVYGQSIKIATVTVIV